MRKVLIMIFFALAVNTNGQTKTSVVSDKEIPLVIIKHVDLVGIFSFMSISCEEFDNSFHEIMETDTIRNSTKIAELYDYLNHLTPDNSSSSRRIDTRAKIYITSSSDTAIVCLDRIESKINGQFYNTSDELRKYIEDLQK